MTELTRYGIAGEFCRTADVEELIATLREQIEEEKRTAFRYKSIAGAGLNGTDEVEEIAAAHKNPYDAFNESYVRHRTRIDATLNAMLSTLREQLEARGEEIVGLRDALYLATQYVRKVEGTIPRDAAGANVCTPDLQKCESALALSTTGGK